MEIDKERKKIFIAQVDSKLGFHISQQLRDDHVSLNNFSYIVGSSSTCQSTSVHPIIHGTVNYQDNIQLFGQAVLVSDVLILDIRQASEEVQFVIKLVEQRAKEIQAGRETNNKKLRIIGIGSHMTWAYSKQTLSGLEADDKQHGLTKLLSFEPKNQQTISELGRCKRIAHHDWARERQIQKSIQNLNKYKDIKSCILTVGLIYGKDVPSPELENLLARCFSVSEEVWVYGDGNNVLPTTHVDDLCQGIQCILKEMQQSCPTKFQAELIAVDPVVSTQLQIVQQFLKNSGYLKTIKKQQLSCLTKEEALMSQSIPLRRSSQLPKSKQGTNSICDYFEQCFLEICNEVQLQIKHYVIYSPELEGSELYQLENKLSSVIQVLRQDDLALQMCNAKNITREELDIHELSHSIEQNYLIPHHNQNYVLILNQNLLDVNVIKKYNLNKYQLKADSEYLLSHKFKLFENNENQHQAIIVDETTSQSGKDITEVSKVVPIDSNQNIRNEQENESKKTISLKALKKNTRIDQFLIDNAVGYISQALMKVGSNPQLSTFIESLKQIYNRQMGAIRSNI